MMASRRLVTLVIVGVIMTACGGGTDEAATTATDTLAIITPTPVSTDAPSPQAGATPAASAAVADQPPLTTVVEQDDQSVAVEAEPDNAAATTKTDSEEQPEEPQVTLIANAPDDPWGKERPEGPIPTAPPAPPSDFDSDGDGMYTPEELDEAIRYRFPEYEWPPNYQLDLDKALEASAYSKNDRIEAPGEYSFLGLYHACAWELTLIDAALENDQELIDESLYQLVEFGQNKNPLSHDESGKAFMRDMYDRAALGDVAPLQKWVDTNCEQRRQYFITPGSATPMEAAADSPPAPTFVASTDDQDETIVKEVPTGPAPTEVSLSRESSFDSDGDGYYTYEELEQAVTALMPSYEFPANYQVTPDIMMMSMKPFASSGARWRVPMEYTVLETYHQCAWQLAWLDAYRLGDVDLMEESLYQLQTVALAGRTMDPSLRDWMVEMYDRAALGDPTLIQRDVDSSCLMEWATPTTGTPSAIRRPNDSAL